MKESISNLNDFFKTKSMRTPDTFFMSAICSYDDEIHSFLLKYYDSATKSGTIIENKLENPNNNQILYMNEIISSDFELSIDFINNKINKWLHTLNSEQTTLLSKSMYSVFIDLKESGKNETILKNAYMKFMCWIYYRFGSVLSQICKNDIPKIMYEGNITLYELYMLKILNRCGCDVLILDYGTLDKIKSEKIFPPYLDNKNNTPFPVNFCIKSLYNEIKKNDKISSICGPKSSFLLCRNTWMDNAAIDEITKVNRSDNINLICSSFLKFNGTDNRNTYINDLYRIYDIVKTQGRNIEIINDGIPTPSPSEVSNIKRINCNDFFDVLSMIINNIHMSDCELTKYAKHMFNEYLIKHEDSNINKLDSNVIKLLVLFNRYKHLFSMEKPGCMFILEKQNLKEVDYVFLDFISQFPLDIVIINVKKESDKIQSSALEFTYSNDMQLDRFPTEKTEVACSTTAYNAENDLTSMLYTNTGIYRNRQYKKAEPIILKTMYDEIDILWEENLNMRQGFNIKNNIVTIPCIFAKICGIKNGNKKAYIKDIERLICNNQYVMLIKDYFTFNFESDRPINIASVMTNGNIDADKIKNHQSFKYSYMREETLDFMINQLNCMLHSSTIKGMCTHGAENNLLNIFFNLPKDMLELIQKFDFTKINPKIVYINTGNIELSLDETIFLQYASFLGFDVVMFIPTGYNTVEKYFDKKLFTEYQIGDYVYDLSVNIKRKKRFF